MRVGVGVWVSESCLTSIPTTLINVGKVFFVELVSISRPTNRFGAIRSNTIGYGPNEQCVCLYTRLSCIWTDKGLFLNTIYMYNDLRNCPKCQWNRLFEIGRH